MVKKKLIVDLDASVLAVFDSKNKANGWNRTYVVNKLILDYLNKKEPANVKVSVSKGRKKATRIESPIAAKTGRTPATKGRAVRRKVC